MSSNGFSAATPPQPARLRSSVRSLRTSQHLSVRPAPATHRRQCCQRIIAHSSNARLGRAEPRCTCRQGNWLWRMPAAGNYASAEQLELTEENIEVVLQDARVELMQMFDESVGMTGRLSLAELDGPFVKLGFTGRFWHARQMVLDRVAAYLISRIPEILEVSAADEAELSDSPAMFGQGE